MSTATKPNHIGHKIGRIRELRGLKQESLAYELKVSQQTVSKIEQSENVEDQILEQIAKILGVRAAGIILSIAPEMTMAYRYKHLRLAFVTI